MPPCRKSSARVAMRVADERLMPATSFSPFRLSFCSPVPAPFTTSPWRDFRPFAFAHKRSAWAVLQRKPASLIQRRDEVVRPHLDLIQDLAHKWPTDVLAFMVRQGGVLAIRMPIEHVAAFLPSLFEPPFEQDTLEGPRIHNGKLAHTAMEKDCSPTNSGRNPMSSSLISSKHNSTTSFKFTCS